MKVLLINSNREVTYSPVAPLGLAYLYSTLQSYDHEVDLLDLSVVLDWELELESVILNFQPECIGISIRNIDNSSFTHYKNYLPETQKIIQCVQHLSNSPLVLGGSAFSQQPYLLMEYFNCEYGIAGEGEVAFPLLLDFFSGKGEIHEIPNLIYKLAEDNHNNVQKYHINESKRMIGEQFIRPNRGPLYKSFLGPGDLGNLETRRGCVFQCIYCNIPSIAGRQIQYKKQEDIIGEIKEMISSGYKKVYIVDNIFNYPYSFSLDLCTSLIEHKLKIDWQCQIHPRFFDDRLAEVMKAAGCSNIDIGATSACNRVLSLLKKGFNKVVLLKAIDTALNNGIKINVFFNFGVPGETLESLNETIAYMYEIENKGATVACEIGLRILPGTELATFKTTHTAKLDIPSFYIEESVKEEVLKLYRKLPSRWTKQVSSAIYEALLRKVPTYEKRRLYIDNIKRGE